MKTLASLFATAALVGVSAAHAATYNLTYTNANGSAYSAVLTGDLGVDGNTITNIVTSTFTVSGNSFTATINSSLSEIFEKSGVAGFLTLDGSSYDYYAGDGVAFYDFGIFADQVDDYAYDASSNLGAGNRASYSLEEAGAAVPLPAALPLSLAALGGLAALRRRAA
ncbi:MAG: hypothetical protein ACPGNV_05895 [Mangrovicoccus sp.]